MAKIFEPPNRQFAASGYFSVDRLIAIVGGQPAAYILVSMPNQFLVVNQYAQSSNMEKNEIASEFAHSDIWGVAIWCDKTELPQDMEIKGEVRRRFPRRRLSAR